VSPDKIFPTNMILDRTLVKLSNFGYKFKFYTIIYQIWIFFTVKCYNPAKISCNVRVKGRSLLIG